MGGSRGKGNTQNCWQRWRHLITYNTHTQKNEFKVKIVQISSEEHPENNVTLEIISLLHHGNKISNFGVLLLSARKKEETTSNVNILTWSDVMRIFNRASHANIKFSLKSSFSFFLCTYVSTVCVSTVCVSTVCVSTVCVSTVCVSTVCVSTVCTLWSNRKKFRQYLINYYWSQLFLLHSYLSFSEYQFKSKIDCNYCGFFKFNQIKSDNFFASIASLNWLRD